MSYLSRRSREISEEEERRKYPSYDFVMDRWLKPGYADRWIDAENMPLTREYVSWKGRAG